MPNANTVNGVLEHPELALGLVAALWALVTLLLSERRANGDWIQGLFAQLEKHGDVVREDPAIQTYLCNTWSTPPDAFKESGTIPRDDLFFKAKTIVYSELNVFDSFVARTTRRGRPLTYFGRCLQRLLIPNSRELANWEEYVICKMQHPLSRAVIEEEEAIFGESLREFYKVSVVSRTKTPSKYLW